MIADLPLEQIRQSIDQLAEELLLQAGVAQPPVDAFLVSQRLGLTVACDQACQARGRLVRFHSGSARRSTILLAEEQRRERRQWALAHELGEAHVHQIVARLGLALVELTPGRREQLASHFAQALLLPFTWFERWGRQLEWDLVDLKQVFSTASHELLACRMLDMHPAVILSVFDHGRLSWRRSNFGYPPPLTSDEREVWQLAHLTGCVAHDPDPSFEQLGEICCWPEHEPEWKREILRTEVELFC